MLEKHSHSQGETCFQIVFLQMFLGRTTWAYNLGFLQRSSDRRVQGLKVGILIYYYCGKVLCREPTSRVQEQNVSRAQVRWEKG